LYIFFRNRKRLKWLKLPVIWSLNIRKIKDLDRMHRISTNLNEEEIELRRKAFHMKKYPLVIE